MRIGTKPIRRNISHGMLLASTKYIFFDRFHSEGGLDQLIYLNVNVYPSPILRMKKVCFKYSCIEKCERSPPFRQWLENIRNDCCVYTCMYEIFYERVTFTERAQNHLKSDK